MGEESGARAAVGAVLASLVVLYALTAVGRGVPQIIGAVAACGGVLLLWLRHLAEDLHRWPVR